LFWEKSEVALMYFFCDSSMLFLFAAGR
jgi:hypothetical protein